uniref:LNR domain-containing protein n=1 Tax=Corethron hystrix TaxID=216773 RepID=A0A7S1BF59_9STRA|mmetsp:Transcript_24524/g.56053  ORF Transcript_24524/g.56053 Transcript_24524/m.56053 type:complete len:321 (+) Transcript_24524:233-1195(+)
MHNMNNTLDSQHGCDHSRCGFLRKLSIMSVLIPASYVLAHETLQVDKKIDNRFNRKKGANLRSRELRNLDVELDCAEIKECDFSGFDESFIGDGWCDWDIGCYNTAACGFDGGDCCKESCEASTHKNKWLTCGMGGYVCMQEKSLDSYSTMFEIVSSESDLAEEGSAQYAAAMFIKFEDGDHALSPDDDRFLQRYIMSVFYFSISNGKYGTFQGASHECKWPGVTCSNKKIREIKLDNLQMTGSIPAEIFSIPGLESLDLSHNDLSGELRANIDDYDQLASLQLLNLSYNNLSGEISDGVLDYLNEIDDLNLKSNNFTDV